MTERGRPQCSQLRSVAAGNYELRVGIKAAVQKFEAYDGIVPVADLRFNHPIH